MAWPAVAGRRAEPRVAQRGRNGQRDEHRRWLQPRRRPGRGLVRRQRGKGHGWQSAKRHAFPVSLEVRLPQVETIDTLILATWPAVIHGVNWMGVRNFDIEVEYRGAWVRVLTVRANTEGLVTVRLPATPASAVRFVILRANSAAQEDNKNDDEDFARVLQVGIYRLGIPTPARGEELRATIERGPKGSVAIYRDQLPVPTPNASSPEYLASVFRKVGYGVTYLDSKQLYAAGILNRKNFDVFVHPYGAPFPAGTQLGRFLEQGGHLITLGGHPFRRALWFSPEGRLIDGGCELGLTTAASRVGDYGLSYREQLGMFYNGYEKLADVAVARTAPDQIAVRSKLEVPGSYEGEAAAALVGERWSIEETRAMAEEGSFPRYAQAAREGIATVTAYANMIASDSSFDSKNGYMFNWPRSRWTPLVNGYDRHGRLRGALVSMLRNYHAPYRGSGWIFCGVANRDLFTREHPEFTAALLEALESLREPAMLRDAQSALACYRQGESAEVGVTVERFGKEPGPLSVRFAIYAEGTPAPVFEQSVTVDKFTEAHRRVVLPWKPARFASDLYRVHVTLLRGDRAIDTTETGFTVWQPELLATGPRLEFRDNYFALDGRRALLIGARTDGIYPHGEVDEDVPGVDRQFAMMRDYGMQVVSSVYFSGYIPGLTWGRVNEEELIPLQLLRAMDAQVQLAQKHHLVYAPCLFFEGKFMAMENHELTRRICEFLARRYAAVPGMMFYVFDDGTADVPVDEFRRFAEVCTKALNSASRSFYVLAESGGIGLQRYGSDSLTMPANGNYVPGIPSFYKLMDRRLAGRSFHLSEFGVNAPGSKPGDYDPDGPYPSVNASGSVAGDYSTYLLEPHMLFGAGGSYVLNWVWKDPAQLLFPWGVTHPNDFTPKEPLFAYRNEGFFLRHFQPIFHAPEVILVCPRERLLRDERVYEPYLRAVIDLLIEQNVQFALLDDAELSKLPPGPRTLIYADPRYADRPILKALLERVRAGDRLFLAGEFARSPAADGANDRSLFGEIAGLTWAGAATADAVVVTPSVAELTPYIGTVGNLLNTSGATVLATDPDGHAVVAERRLGAGSVFYTADPTAAGARRALGAFLRRNAVASVPLQPRVAHRPVFELDRAGGGKIYSLFATRPEGDWKTRWNGPWIEAPESYTLDTGAGSLRIPLGSYGVSLVALRGDHQVDALEGQGRFETSGSLLFESEPHAMLMSLDNTPLDHSSMLALFTLGAGSVALRAAPGDYVVEAGEFRSGAFVRVAEVQAKVEAAMLRFHVDSVQTKLLLLIARRDSLGEARRRMTEALR